MSLSQGVVGWHAVCDCGTFWSHSLTFALSSDVSTINIDYECEGRTEKSVPRIAVWHHEACRVMTNGDPEGRIFLSFPCTNNGFFFLLTTVFYIFINLIIYLFVLK